MRLATALLGSFVCVSQLAAQSRSMEALRREYESKLRTLKIECGQRHLELGVECRKKGLTTQAAEQIVLAVEVSERLNPGANTVLGMLRTYDEAFWSKRAPRPTAARLDAYAKQAAKIAGQDLDERLELLLWADKRGFEGEAGEDLVALLRQRDEPLEFDADKALSIGPRKLPAALSARVWAESILINGRRYLRDDFLTKLPAITQLFEAVDERLRVRSLESLEQATALHALGSVLLPRLEADLGARPTRRLALVVVPARATYEAYLDAARLGASKVASGVADSASLTAILCSAGQDEIALAGLVLHELTHVYHFGITRGVMPSWYAEGLADSYGGAGTFRWEGGELATGAQLGAAQLAPLKAGPLPFTLDALLGADALGLWTSDPQRARAFYAQSWAWMRFLREGAGTDVAERFARWETMCRGGATGAEIGKPRDGSSAEAARLFRNVIGADLAKLEARFPEWLAGL